MLLSKFQFTSIGGMYFMRLLGTAASGIRAQQVALDVIGDNLANANTTGFKANQPDFAEALANELRPAGMTMNGSSVGANLNVGAGVLYNGIGVDFKQGTFQTTDRPLDAAINGSGFFEVTTANGDKAYTRDGNFQIDAAGNLCDQSGNWVSMVNEQGEALPSGSLLNAQDPEIGSDGVVTANLDGEKMTFGQIPIAVFPNQEGLQKIGSNLYVISPTSGAPQFSQAGTMGAGSIQSKSLEASNVDVAANMTDLIQVQRAYQLNSRMVSNGDQMWGIANSLRRS